MTYALAWKTDTDVFLAADTALTTYLPTAKLHLKSSSFGYDHVQTDKKVVQESAVKLFLKNAIGIAFAGRYELAVSVAKSFYEKRDEGHSHLEALKNALFLNSPFPKDATLQLAVGYYENGPHLLTFDSLKGTDIRDDQRIVHMGNVPDPMKEVAENWIFEIITNITNDPAQLLVSAIGFLQSSSIFDNLLEIGIGGAFTGIYVNQNGGKWQPDVIFIEDEKYVGTCVRHDCLVVHSPVIGQSRCFSTYLPPRTKEDLLAQVEKAKQKARKVRDSGEYEFAVVRGESGKPLVLLELRRNTKHALLWLKPFKDEHGHKGMTLSKFPELRKIFREHKGHALMFYYPYERPTVKKIPDDKKFVRTI